MNFDDPQAVFVPSEKNKEVYSNNDAYEYFNYCISDPKSVELKIEISRRLMIELIKEEQREQARQKSIVKKPVGMYSIYYKYLNNNKTIFKTFESATFVTYCIFM